MNTQHSLFGTAADGPGCSRPKRSLRTGFRFGAAAAATGALAASAALALIGAASANAQVASPSIKYHFHTLNNKHDLTFNQLLGINNHHKIVGYFGSGAKGHPNKGYELLPPYAQRNYRSENFPGSKQTQVTGLNDKGVTVGFWSTQNKASMINNNFGFYAVNGKHFKKVDFPTRNNFKPPVDQLLGVNNSDVAVGFYSNSQGNNRGYEYFIKTRQFIRVQKPGTGGSSAPSLTAAAINNHNTVAGFYVNKSGVTVAFVRTASGGFTTIAVKGASMTQAFGINDHGVVAGSYMVGTGSGAKSFGFTWQRGRGFTTISDPHGIGSTVVNGINNSGELVGFYTDGKGNVDGMLATP